MIESLRLKPAALWGLVLALVFLQATGTVKGEDDNACTTLRDKPCPENSTEIYRDAKMDVNDPTKTKGPVKRRCCPEGSDQADKELDKASGCQISRCLDPNQFTAGDNTICLSGIDQRWVAGSKLDYRLAARDKCERKGGEIGTEALCCPKNSKEGMLTLLLGAELHQFPHYAWLTIRKGHSVSMCGATIYNERYLITASHCMVSEGVMKSADGAKIKLDMRIANMKKNPISYDVEKFIPHPNSTRWQKDSHKLYNDIALVKLKKKIEFGPNVKALPIAEKGFDPFEYSHETVLVGLGQTDTEGSPSMLQRARTTLRKDDRNLKRGVHWNKVYSKDEADGLLFLGGVQDGVTAPRSGKGDSGGPAICRDKDGFAVLCGTDSGGPDLERCEDKLDERHCFPEVYMETQHYHDWIVKEAGDQKNAQVLKQPLFGEAVPRGKYEHQVHITTRDGPSCGGTLIEKDLVLTAAHCVVRDDGRRRSTLKVMTGVRDLNVEKQGKEMEVKNLTVLDGFQRGKASARPRRIARLNVMPTPKYPYYKNDLALIKLKSKADISSKNLPSIGAAPMSSGDMDQVTWTTEVSLPDHTKSGKLQQREFQILDHAACQRRMDRASFAGPEYTVTVDGNILCGEEKYNGGAQCDRELGGGLICKGQGGKDVLCGVQVFRFCQLALPSAFLDISKYNDWIAKAKSKM